MDDLIEQVQVKAHRRLVADDDRVFLSLPPGLPLVHYLKLVWTRLEGVHARVTIDGEVIARAQWETYCLNPGQIVIARAIPMGGGEGGKGIIRIVAMVGLIALAAFTAGGGLAALAGYLGGAGAWAGAAGLGLAGGITSSIAAAAISIGGSLAISALIPPPRPRLAELSGATSASPTLSLTGVANQLAPYAPIPQVLGRHRMYPPLASRIYTEVVGADQYLRALFCFGYGPVDISDLKIGETPIDEFDDLEVEIHHGFPGEGTFLLFPDDVFEDQLSIALTSAGSWQQRTTQQDLKELSLDIAFPFGLYQTTNTGLVNRTVQVEVEARKVGEVSWIPVNDTSALAASAQVGTGHSGLVFTHTSLGSHGNNWKVRTGASGSGVVEQAPPNNRTSTESFVLSIKRNTVGVKPAVPTAITAATVKAQLEAIPAIATKFTITFPAGGNGSGLFQNSPGVAFFSGGRNRVTSFQITARQTTAIRSSLRWIPPDADLGQQWEVRMRRLTGDTGNVTISDKVFWTVMRTLQTTNPVTKTGLAGLAMRIRATGQLSGTLDNVNAIVTSIVKDWDADVGDWVERPTSNPASLYRHVLQGKANRRPKTDAQLDLTTIQAFHEYCTAQNFRFNAVIDFRTTAKQLRADVLAAARGAFHLRDMKYSVLYEVVQDTPVDIISSRNSSSPTWKKRFVEIPHARRVRYVDEDSDFRQNERVVYADGYTASTATIIEEADAGLGVTQGDQVWKMKRREFAEAQLRADDYTVRMDFEHLKFTRGDRVEHQMDMVLAAITSGRITNGTQNGDNLVTQLNLDEAVLMEDGKDYGVRIRTAHNLQCVGHVVTVPGEQTTVMFNPPIPNSQTVAPGDLFTFGLFGQETVSRIVKSIRPSQDYSAVVSLVDYAPGILLADTGTIPPYEGHVTSPASDRRLIAPPIIESVQSDEAVLVEQSDGSLQSRIVVTVYFPSGFRYTVNRVEARFRVTGTDAEWIQVGLSVDGTTNQLSLTPVIDGEMYDLQVRSINTEFGATSSWNQITAYPVIGKTSPPPDVEVVVIEGDRLRWNYANPPRDLAGFIVRYRSGIDALWDSAAPAHDNLLLTTDFTIFRGIGPMTFMVKAVDMAGNQSVTPGRVTINFGTPLPDHIVIEDNHRTLGWPGTKTNSSVVSNQLVAASSTPFWTVDSARMWSEQASTLMWPAVPDVWLALSYELLFSPPPDLLEATLKLLHQIEGVWSIQYRSDSTAPMWNEDDSVLMWGSSSNPLWSARGPYIQWPGALTPLTHQAYQIRVTTAAGIHRGVLDQLSVFLDLATLEESLNDIVLAPGGTRLPLTKTFRQIFSVRPDLQDDGGSAAYLKVMDKNVDLHPLVTAFDSSDVTTGALIDAVVSGI